jgi:hypothetical protein
MQSAHESGERVWCSGRTQSCEHPVVTQCRVGEIRRRSPAVRLVTVRAPVDIPASVRVILRDRESA